MLLIEDNVVYLTRGDDAEIEVRITDGDGAEYTMREDDRMVLTVRELPEATSAVLLSVESESNRLALDHDATANMDVGRYSADIELRIGTVRKTIWPELDGRARYSIRNYRNFVIMPEVTQ